MGRPKQSSSRSEQEKINALANPAASTLSVPASVASAKPTENCSKNTDPTIKKKKKSGPSGKSGVSKKCPHGRKKSLCKECGGAGLCPHGKRKNYCKDCGGASICEHGKRKNICKECGGAGLCSHGRQNQTCKICSEKCSHGKMKCRCEVCNEECKQVSIHCPHGNQKNQCTECKKAFICKHGKRRYKCTQCGGRGTCEHGRLRNYCRDCCGNSLCVHDHQIHRCRVCKQICKHGVKSGRCDSCVWDCYKVVLPPLKKREVPTGENHDEGLPWLSDLSSISKSCSESSSPDTSRSFSRDEDGCDMFDNQPCSPNHEWLTSVQTSSDQQSSDWFGDGQESHCQQSSDWFGDH